MNNTKNKKESFETYTYGNYGKTNDWYSTNLNNANSLIDFQNRIQNNTNNISKVDTSSPNYQPASFNYDSLYNTKDLTQKYSFIKSSFLYRPFSTNDNDYLSQVYFNNNPLEVEATCANLDNTTCGLTSACVYTGNNNCVPGNINGPYTSYSDINVDYYYYKGKCYGNCPGKFYPKATSSVTSAAAFNTTPGYTSGATSGATSSATSGATSGATSRATPGATPGATR